MSETKAILIEMGIHLPGSVQVEVHEDTARFKNLVIPESLPGSDESTVSSSLYRTIINKACEDRGFKTQLSTRAK
ncbi:hypothetical protein H1P_90014 [Hyella patelloides LEGE 07179]|uniref:Uncharacterized protein n=1 Tax=Hyella patelloides LEGE 07179 TaxID=945734 RepID=A0A563W543_9CYAN|nr:hypothetical protein H1P_90014 [Hyella patelloides LEGE 07179]